MDTIKINKQNVKMIAHRGLCGIGRENTCSAFIAAGNRSYFGIETDVHKTKDGQYVIIHDEDTKRITLGKQNVVVSENPYSALKDIVLPDLDGSVDRQDIRIPLLIEYIKICKKYKKIAVLELKIISKENEIIKIIDIIETVDYLQNIIFISFDLKDCKTLRKLLPKADVQWLLSEEITENIIKILVEYNLDLDANFSVLSREIIEKFILMALKLIAGHVIKKEAENLIKMGVDYITTNILE